MAGEILRSPDARFEGLPDFPWAPQYVEIQGLRIHRIDEGPREARPILLLHGEPTWCFLYRKMIPALLDAGHRVIAPDLVGFGRSDKPARLDAYSYQWQVEVIAELVRGLGLRGAILFGQDWGGLVGLRVVAEDPDRFAAVVASNTGLPAPGPGDRPPLAFRAWQTFARYSPVFSASRIVDFGSVTRLSRAERRAYDAPFPTRAHQAGARAMPSHVPISPADPQVPANRKAWDVLHAWDKPFLTAFGDRDPITRGLGRRFQEEIPGARGEPHTLLKGGGHFIQEDKGPELAQMICALAARLPA
ncbi:MAG: haloalkane dehalogenase [Myxococcales bacterium]|nr:haloalkane dehalogenase [Myxococcales bacterium]